eukprot:CAMPEP_0194429726 /NCGR_PEP_ID=MMETSP0176-20130528/49137_1 /TAXON_ID=216777 /ORGANISM="Proboscia alata, Strain PI-D3" /LENGTH=63 /DNA_ID=CAMNT_0039243143 /DNA_START=32 /DNA_END=223 /DNA_ORIENTATION=+
MGRGARGCLFMALQRTPPTSARTAFGIFRVRYQDVSGGGARVGGGSWRGFNTEVLVHGIHHTT